MCLLKQTCFETLFYRQRAPIGKISEAELDALPKLLAASQGMSAVGIYLQSAYIRALSYIIPRSLAAPHARVIFDRIVSAIYS